MLEYNLAQINIAKMKYQLDDPAMSGFVNRLDEINTLAENSPGYIWRLMDDPANTGYSELTGENNVLVNMSVWDSIDNLKYYVYKSAHLELMIAKEQWFEKIQTAHLALWWVPAGHVPDISEGSEKLRLLQQNGPTSQAFTIARPFSKPD